jgi:hypothetical protein
MADRPKHTQPTVFRPREVPLKPAATSGPAESVEDFLARGGQVEHLDHGAGSQPVLRTLREIHDQTWRIAQANRPDKEPESG